MNRISRRKKNPDLKVLRRPSFFQKRRNRRFCLIFFVILLVISLLYYINRSSKQRNLQSRNKDKIFYDLHFYIHHGCSQGLTEMIESRGGSILLNFRKLAPEDETFIFLVPSHFTIDDLQKEKDIVIPSKTIKFLVEDFIFDSVAANSLLPHRNYHLYQESSSTLSFESKRHKKGEPLRKDIVKEIPLKKKTACLKCHDRTIPDCYFFDLHKRENNPSSNNRLQVTEYDASKHYKFVLGINTLQRVDKKSGKVFDYLEKTVGSLWNDLKDLNERKGSAIAESVLSVIQNLEESERDHVKFRSLHDKFKKLNNFENKLKKNIIFHTIVDRLSEPFLDVKGHDYKHPNNEAPGHVARQQNMDVLSLIHLVEDIDFSYFVFIEDDFIFCNKTLEQLFYVVTELENQDPSFCTLRFSYGMNGIVIEKETLMQFGKFLSKNMDCFPIDLMIYKFQRVTEKDKYMGKKSKGNMYEMCKRNSMGRERINYIYHKNLMEHKGDYSSFEERNDKKRFKRPPFSRCFDNTRGNRYFEAPGNTFSIKCDQKKSALTPCSVNIPQKKFN